MYRLVTSIETRIALLGALILSLKLIKSVESLSYDSCSFAMVVGVCLQMQTTFQSDHHIQKLLVFFGNFC